MFYTIDRDGNFVSEHETQAQALNKCPKMGKVLPSNYVEVKNADNILDLARENQEGLFLFETYGNDLEEVLKMHKKHPNRVVTILDVGDLYCSLGFQQVNRLGYILLEKPVKPFKDFLYE